jgi:hypothetical protein
MPQKSQLDSPLEKGDIAQTQEVCVERQNAEILDLEAQRQAALKMVGRTFFSTNVTNRIRQTLDAHPKLRGYGFHWILKSEADKAVDGLVNGDIVVTNKSPLFREVFGEEAMGRDGYLHYEQLAGSVVRSGVDPDGCVLVLIDPEVHKIRCQRIAEMTTAGPTRSQKQVAFDPITNRPLILKESGGQKGDYDPDVVDSISRYE